MPTFLKGFFDRAFDSADNSKESLPLPKNRIFIKDLIPDFSTKAGKTVRDPEMMPVFSSTALFLPKSGWCDGVSHPRRERERKTHVKIER